jgi:hypothetical protein
MAITGKASTSLNDLNLSGMTNKMNKNRSIILSLDAS